MSKSTKISVPTGMFGIPSKSAGDNEQDEHLLIVRKAEMPIIDLVSMTMGKVDHPLTKEQWQTMKMLLGIHIDLQDSLVKIFNEVIESKSMWSDDIAIYYVPAVYKIYEIAQKTEMPKDHILKLVNNFSARTIISEFNYVHKESLTFFKKHFIGVDYDDEIIRLFSQSYVANFIAIEEQIRLIHEETK